MKQLLMIALAIAAPALPQVTGEPRTDEERGTLQAYSACLYGFARELDHHAMAPLTLARQIAPKCRFQLGIAASILSRGKPRAQRDALYARWITLEDQRGVQAVLTMREDSRTAALAAARPRQARPPKPKPAPGKRAEMKFAAPTTSPVLIPATGPGGKPISAWRRAYIGRHGHEPPVPAK